MNIVEAFGFVEVKMFLFALKENRFCLHAWLIRKCEENRKLCPRL